jgi:hypothetical protein
MQKRLAIVVAAVITLALPQFAFAQSSAPMQDSRAFVHWQSMGGAGPEPVQTIGGKRSPAPRTEGSPKCA